MRFLRMLTNALLAGALGAAYLTILLLQLNPQIPLFSSSVWRHSASASRRRPDCSMWIASRHFTPRAYLL